MKKNNEEIKERLLKARALSDEELEQVNGGTVEYGMGVPIKCPNCGRDSVKGIYDTDFPGQYSDACCVMCGTYIGTVKRVNAAGKNLN